MDKCNLKQDLKQEKIKDTLKINNEAFVDIWLEDSYKCRDFLGRIAISFLDIFDKGKPGDKKYKDETFEVNYRPKIYSGSESFLNVFDIDAHLDYEVWFYPENYSKDLNIKKSDKHFQKDNKIKKFEDILEGQMDENFRIDVQKTILNISDTVNRFFGFDNKNFEIIKEVDTMKGLDESLNKISDEIKNFYLLDQLGEYRLINSYLSKLTVKADSNENAFSIRDYNVETILRQRRTDIDKIELGIGDSYESLMHYIKCMRFSSYYENNKKKRIMLSPDILMLNRKGNIYEHTIYFACILLNKESEKKIIYKRYLDKKIEINSQPLVEPTEPQNNKENKFSRGKKLSETKTDDVLRDKNMSSINLIGEEKSTLGEENGKLNSNKKKTDEKLTKKKTDKENNYNKNDKKGKNKKDLYMEKIEPVIINLFFIFFIDKSYNFLMKKIIFIFNYLI